MSRKKKESDAPTTDSIIMPDDESDVSPVYDSTTDYAESQAFQSDFNSYTQPEKDDLKKGSFLFIVYADSAPADWKQQLANTGLPFAVSPYHDKDRNPDGSQKKPHWHVIVTYGNRTTYRNAKELRNITKGPFPIACASVSGSYAYFTHKHNPEKAPYNEHEIERYNGWEKTLEKNEVSAIMAELTKLICLEDIQEYAELMVIAEIMGGDYLSVAMSHTIHFNAMCRSYRHNPIRVLSRFMETVEDDDLRKEIEQRMYQFREDEEENERKYGK